MTNEKKVVLITGASSGMGHASAKYFYDHGWIVYAGARRTQRMKDLQELGIYWMLRTMNQIKALSRRQ